MFASSSVFKVRDIVVVPPGFLAMAPVELASFFLLFLCSCRLRLSFVGEVDADEEDEEEEEDESSSPSSSEDDVSDEDDREVSSDDDESEE